MLRIGLTGGIASGKSAVAAELRALGVEVVDADQLSRRVVEPGEPALEEITSRFGPEVIGPDGRLDRKALARIVFDDGEARSALEAITHPRIVAEALRWFLDAERSGAPFAVFEVPLLFETGLEELFDRVVVVSASPEVQRARAAARDDLSEDEVAARLDAQMPTAEKARRADFVVDNDGTLAELEAAVRALHQELVAIARGGGE